MTLLLDTHAFIWWDSQPGRLSSSVLQLCQDQSNTLLISVASIWEMQIKLQLGKLKLNLPLGEIIEGQQRINNVRLLPVLLEHVLHLERLPLHHKDPFDRLLIAQANVENATLASNDPVFTNYQVELLW